MVKSIEQKGMTFDNDFCYSFTFSSSIYFQEGREKEKRITKVVVKSHAFLLDRKVVSNKIGLQYLFVLVRGNQVLFPFVRLIRSTLHTCPKNFNTSLSFSIGTIDIILQINLNEIIWTFKGRIFCSTSLNLYKVQLN